MMTSSKCCAVFVIVAAVVVTASTPQPLLLPYNAHSFDDVGMWQQQVMKGVRWIKVDVQAATADSCEHYSSWNTTMNTCYNSTSSSSSSSTTTTVLCCLALRGDTSSVPHLTSPFNTTYDMLRWLDEHASVLTDLRVPLRFQLDFCTGQHGGEPVGALFDAFLSSLEARVKILSVETPGYCGYEGLAINDEINGISGRCQDSDWPPSTLPYMFWEPSTQADIRTTLTELESKCPTLPPAHRDVRNGTAFACNLEQEMYQVYGAAQLPGGTANQTSIDDGTVSASFTMLPTTTTTTTTTAAAMMALVRAYGPSHTNADMENQTLTFIRLPGGERVPQVTPLHLHGRVHSVSATVVKGTSVYVAAVTPNEVGVYTCDPDGSRVAEYATYTFPPNVTGLVVGGQMVQAGAAGSLAIITAVIATTDCALQVNMYALPNDDDDGGGGGGGGDAVLMATTCIVPLGSGIQVLNASLSVVLSSFDMYAGLLIYSTSSNGTTGGSLDINGVSLSVAKSPTTGQWSVVAPTGPTRLDYGTAPHVSVVELSDGQVVVIESHENGMCQTGLGINNGDYNHCQIPLGLVAGLTNIPGLLNYNYGRLQHWQEAIAAGRPLLGGCDPYIIHAKYDAGTDTHISVYTDWSSQEVRVAEVHQGLPSPGGLLAICGQPDPATGTVFSSFRIVQPSDLP